MIRGDFWDGDVRRELGCVFVYMLWLCMRLSKDVLTVFNALVGRNNMF